MTSCNFVTEALFEEDGAGRYWAIGEFRDASWDEQLALFDHIRIVARIRRVEISAFPVEIDDPRVSLVPLPAYQQPRQLLARLVPLLRSLWRASALEGGFLLRMPGVLGTLASLCLRLRGRPYAVQLVGDPYDVLGSPDLSPLLRAFRRPARALTRWVCRRAAVIAYVTETTLQRRYPPGREAVATPFSDINLPESWLAAAPRDRAPGVPARLFLCGSLARLYKGPDTLIHAVSILAGEGHDVAARIAGDGRCRPGLEALAARLGVADRIAFLGNLASAGIMAELDAADLFVMPSRTEGLPRALIEAMARALPCIATGVGGIPELLASEELVPVDAPDALAGAIAALAADPERCRRLSRRNWEVAARYTPSALREKRLHFFGAVRAMAEGRQDAVGAAA